MSGRKKKQRFRVQPPPQLPFRYYVVGKLVEALDHVPKIIFACAVLWATVHARREDIPKIVDSVAGVFKEASFAGWIVAAVVLLVSILALISVVRFYRNQIFRISDERNGLQERLLNQKVRHSE